MSSSVLDTLTQKQQQLESELEKIESKISEAELAYLQADFSQAGNVLKGFEGFLSTKDALRKRSRNTKVEDRTISLSSKTSPVTREYEEQALAGADMLNTDMLAVGGKRYAGKGYPAKGRR